MINNKYIEYEIDYKYSIFKINSLSNESNLYKFFIDTYFVSEAILCFINKNKNNCKSDDNLIKHFNKFFS